MGGGGLKSIKIAKGKERRESWFYHLGTANLFGVGWGGVGRGRNFLFTSCFQESYSWENVPGTFLLEPAYREPVGTKVLPWTSCHLGPSVT